MPGDPQECRENAKRCLELAQSSRTHTDRERFEGLAQRWLVLATDYEAANLLLARWSPSPSHSGSISTDAEQMQNSGCARCRSPQPT